MKTLIIRIGEAVTAPAGYPVELFFEDGRQDWWRQPLVTGLLPKTLALAEIPPPLPSLDALPDPNATSAEVFEQIGEYLHLLLDKSGIGPTWRELRRRHPREQPPGSEGIRTIFEVRPAELRAVPWETLRDGTWRLFVDAANPGALGTIDFAAPAPPPEWPVRVLVVVGCAPDDQDIDWKAELRGVETALRDLRHAVDYEILRQPSLPALRAEYAAFRPHVFHFIGHGVKDVATGRPALELWDDAVKVAQLWRADDIRAVLSVAAPRFAFLNACRSSAEEVVGWDLARAFLDAGAVAVLGMRGDVRDTAAAAIAKRVYGDLSLGRPLDLALADARVDVSVTAGVEQHWTLPRLVLTVPPERVLSLGLGHDEEGRRQIVEAADFSDLFDFVDRRLERRSLRQKVEPTSARNLIIVVGDEKIGKTALVRWCLQGAALRGRRVRYVDLDVDSPHGFLSILHRIRGEGDDDSSPIRKPLPEAAFQRFLFDLDHFLQGREPPASPPPLAGPVYIDPRRPLQPGAENVIPRIFRSFSTALEQAAKDEPLLLVIDHLKRAYPEDFKKYVKPQLLKPIMDGRVRNVRVVLAAGRRDYDDLELGSLVPGGAAAEQVIRVPAFKPQEFVELACEFCRYHAFDDSEEVIAALAKKVQAEWGPLMLRKVQSLLEGIGA
jgi:hypothetical protein